MSMSNTVKQIKEIHRKTRRKFSADEKKNLEAEAGIEYAYNSMHYQFYYILTYHKQPD